MPKPLRRGASAGSGGAVRESPGLGLDAVAGWESEYIDMRRKESLMLRVARRCLRSGSVAGEDDEVREVVPIRLRESLMPRLTRLRLLSGSGPEVNSGEIVRGGVFKS
jgi:hypothetical protein